MMTKMVRVVANKRLLIRIFTSIVFTKYTFLPILGDKQTKINIPSRLIPDFGSLTESPIIAPMKKPIKIERGETIKKS